MDNIKSFLSAELEVKSAEQLISEVTELINSMGAEQGISKDTLAAISNDTYCLGDCVDLIAHWAVREGALRHDIDCTMDDVKDALYAGIDASIKLFNGYRKNGIWDIFFKS